MKRCPIIMIGIAQLNNTGPKASSEGWTLLISPGLVLYGLLSAIQVDGNRG